ncbi:MAG: MFS transporter [Desulfotomaculales bacterium]
MSASTKTELNAAYLLGRLERLPMSLWQVKLRLVVGTATFFDAFDALTIAYVMPVLIPLWHIKPGEIGLLLSISYVAQILGAIFIGWLSERIGRKKALMSSILIMVVMSVACALAWSYNSLFVFRFIQGLALGAEVPIAATYINEWSKKEGRGPFFVLYESIFNLGMIFTALAATLAIPVFGWRVMFVIGILPALVVPVLAKKYPESPRWMIDHGRYEEAEKSISLVEREISEKYGKTLPPVQIVVENIEKKATKWSELFQGIYCKRTLTLWVIMFAFYFINYAMQTWLPTLYTSQFHVPLQQAFIYSLCVNVTSFVAMVIVGLIIDKVGRRLIFFLDFLGLAVICFLLWRTGIKTAQVLFWYTMVAGLFLNMASLVYLYATEIYPTRMRALGTSVSTSWVRIAAALGPNVVGLVLARYSLSAVFAVFATVGLIGLVIAAAFTEETKNRVLEEISP